MELTEKEIKVEKNFKQPATQPKEEWQTVNQKNERFAKFVFPTPINKEVSWDKSQVILSKTDPYGIIEYANDTFIDVSGYDEFELMGMPHNIVRHPDMPKVLFKVLWDNLKKGNVVKPIVKNLAKSGRYYWVYAEFEIKRNAKGEIINYFSRRRAVAPEVVEKVAPLYDKLLQIEEASGIAASEKYLMGFLEDKGKSYNELIEELVKTYTPQMIEKNANIAEVVTHHENERQKRGFFSRLFGKK